MGKKGIPTDLRTRYQWVWTVFKLRQPEVDGKSCRPVNLPMKRGDKIYVFFVSKNEVCFHRRSKNDAKNDPSWEMARGIFNENTGRITGEIVDKSNKNRRSTFTISLGPDPKTGKIVMTGDHRHNPDDGGWIARD